MLAYYYACKTRVRYGGSRTHNSFCKLRFLMNEKVMVVDDEPDIVRIVKIALELKNYSVIEAYSGEECLEKLESGEIPNLILLDVMLPGINGYVD